MALKKATPGSAGAEKPLKQCIEEILELRKLSVAELKKRCNLSSATSIRRVLIGDAEKRAQLTVTNALLEHKADLELSEQEEEDLKALVRFFQNPIQSNPVYEELWALLRADASVSPAASDRSSESESAPLSLPGFEQDAPIECLIINNCSDELIRWISRLTKACPNCSFVHYMADEPKPSRMVRTIRLLYPFLCKYRYELYIGEKEAPQLTDQVLVLRQGNTEAEIQLHGEQFELRSRNGAYEHWLSVAKGYQYNALTRQFSREAWGALLEECCKKETRHDCYEFMPDLCLRFINPLILEAAFPAELKSFFSPSERSKLLNALYRRYENAFASNKRITLIMSKKSIKNFAETGRTCDHLPFLRPFTLAERIQIFSSLYEAVFSETCKFNIRFLRADIEKELSPEHQMVWTVLRGKSVIIDSTSSSYKFSNKEAPENYNCLFWEVKDPKFVSLAWKFCQNELSAQKAVTEREETLSFLAELIKNLSNELLEFQEERVRQLARVDKQDDAQAVAKTMLQPSDA